MTTRTRIVYARDGYPVKYIIPSAETEEEQEQNLREREMAFDQLHKIQMEIFANISP